MGEKKARMVSLYHKQYFLFRSRLQRWREYWPSKTQILIELEMEEWMFGKLRGVVAIAPALKRAASCNSAETMGP